MSLNFLPGRPNDTPQAMCQTTWQKHTIFAYCSGNNLIIMSNNFTRLQTIYLEKDCSTVDINSANGFIAVGVAEQVHIYKPIYQVSKNPKWAFCCKIFHDPSHINSLKWGHDNELVIGSDFLSFWKIRDEFGEYSPILLWNKRQPKPVYCVTISQDSQLIASFGKYDMTVKLWKRISISGEQDIFNLSLLPHLDYVTNIRWKSSSASSQVLYTLCSDKILRVWACYDVEGGQKIVQNWGTIELNQEERFCIIIDNWMLKKVLSSKDSSNNSYFANYNNISLDLVMTVTNKGKFIIHSLQNLSTDPPKPMTQKALLAGELPTNCFPRDPNFLYFAEIQPCNDTSNEISLLVHYVEGIIRHTTINLPRLLSKESNLSNTFALQHIFTGHNKSIQKLVRSSDGEALLTLSRFSENCIWTPEDISKGGISLYLKNIITTEAPVKLSVLHEKGNLFICLLENSKIQAWECPKNLNMNDKSSTLKVEYTIESSPSDTEPLLMLNTPEASHNHERHFVAIVYSDGSIRSFEVSLDRGIFEVKSNSLDLNGQNLIYRVSTIDPVHKTFFSNRRLLSLATQDGIVIDYKALVDYDNREVIWLKCNETITGVKDPFFIRGSSTGKMCIADSSRKVLSFWDINRGVLEYEETFENEIEDIDWASTELGQSIVSIGFSGYALLYTELRYDYTNNSPTYLPIEKIDITVHTAHNIGDSIWLKRGTFVVASGNQLYIKDKSLDLDDPFTYKSIGSRKILSNDILHLNSVLNGPLPVYHPQFLIQAIYSNKIELVKELLLRLFLKLREIDLTSKDISSNLPSDLDINPSKFFIKRNRDYQVEKFPDPYPVFNKAVCSGLSEQLTKMTLPYLTRHQQITLITVIDAVEDIVKNYTIVDINGIRFLLGIKLYLSHRPQQKHLMMRDVSWALHSDNKELLLSQFDSNTLSWSKACVYKIAFWIKQIDLVKKFEEIARYEFTKNEVKDPSFCSIFYLALRKKQILLGLWKMSYGHPEQQKMMKFLNNDFSQARWKTAALKNAFVLLSKHRYIDAATFFLLAGSLKDCISVLYKQLDDIDLAIGVCRVYEGDNGPVLGEFLNEQLLPRAVQENDRWTTSFIYWKLRKQDVAIKALVTPPIDLEKNSEIVKHETLVNRSFLVEDPALLHLYLILRKRNIKYFMASLEMGTQNEYRLILRVVDILRRMGCNYLSAALVKEWDFITPPKYIKNLYESPKRVGTPVSIPQINEVITEPTKTERVLPSLFDMFENHESKSTSPATPKTQNSIVNAPVDNLLDSISSPVSSQPKSMLDDFKSLHQPKNILEDFMTPAPTPKTAVSPAPNVLESFTVPQPPFETTQGKYSKQASSKQPAKPKNLLDEFM